MNRQLAAAFASACRRSASAAAADPCWRRLACSSFPGSSASTACPSQPLLSPAAASAVVLGRRLLHSGTSAGSAADGTDAVDADDGRERRTHFGFESVSPQEKVRRVQQVFSSVASKYDLMNDVMSAGIHRWWKDHFVKRLDPPIAPDCRFLDVAGGTGDIAFRILDCVRDRRSQLGLSLDKGPHVTICDINPDMLAEGEKRWRSRQAKAAVAASAGTKAGGKRQGSVAGEGEQSSRNSVNNISFIVGDAMQLPFADESFDAYTIAFGIRNVLDIEAALREGLRVLKPGGIFTCLEFSRVQNPVLSHAYDWYSFNLIPVYGEILAGDWDSYQYLVQSIRRFPHQQDFSHMMQQNGFQMVHHENLTNGIACIHTGYKEER